MCTGAETEYTAFLVVSSVFFRKRKARIRCPRKASPESRRARAEEDMIGRASKQSILEKAATKFGFGGQDRAHYVSSGFVRFFRKRKSRIRCPRKASPQNVPFFLLGAKLSKGLFGANPIFREKVRFGKPLRQKPYLYQGILKRA